MSTGINIAPSSDITVGTTAVTSGTDTRVFFQAGGVVQQDANFTFDNTLKRLTLKAVGTAATDIPFAVQNSAGALNLLEFPGTGNLITRHNSSGSSLGLFHRSDTTGFSLTTGTSGYATGSGYEQVSATSYLLAASERMFSFSRSTWAGAVIGWNFVNVGDNSGDQGLHINRGSDPASIVIRSNRNIGIGTTSPGARLDVRAQGALSTDIAFRVRNSADTQNLMSLAGNGDVAIGLNASGVNATFAPGFVAIGTNAKTSQYGLSIGYEAGKNQDNGDRRNVYLGVAVASTGTNSTGTYNVGIGNNALYRVTSGSNNVAIGGVTACFNLTTASDNTIVGTEAGYDITTGAGNTAVGRYAGALNLTGTYNTQIGYAVSQASGQNKSFNVAIGMRLRSSHNGPIMIGSSGAEGSVVDSIADDAAQFHFRSTSQSFFFNKNTNVVLKSNSALVSGTDFEAAATNTITIHNGTAPTTNIATAGQLYAESGALRYRDSAGTITNVGGSVQAVVSAATVTPVYTNKFVKITAQAAALTLANPTGTWAEGQDLMIRIKDDGTARAITWDTNYRAIGVTLPTTTVINKTTYVGIIYNSTDSKWDVIGVTTEA